MIDEKVLVDFLERLKDEFSKLLNDNRHLNRSATIHLLDKIIEIINEMSEK